MILTYMLNATEIIVSIRVCRCAGFTQEWTAALMSEFVLSVKASHDSEDYLLFARKFIQCRLFAFATYCEW